MSEGRSVIRVNGQEVATVTGMVWRAAGSSEAHISGEVKEATLGAMIIGGADVPCIATDEEAERLLGPEFRGLVSWMEKRYRPVVVFIAGTCSRCGASCATQMVTMHINASGKDEALCAGCVGQDAEKRRCDWFAAEERQER